MPGRGSDPALAAARIEQRVAVLERELALVKLQLSEARRAAPTARIVVLEERVRGLRTELDKAKVDIDAIEVEQRDTDVRMVNVVTRSQAPSLVEEQLKAADAAGKAVAAARWRSGAWDLAKLVLAALVGVGLKVFADWWVAPK